ERPGITMSLTDHCHGWPNRPTWALTCWLHAYRGCYLMEVSPACWKAADSAFDRSGRARRAITGKLRRDVRANIAKIESANFNRPLDELDFAAIANHRLAGLLGCRRRHSRL
ncbi:MAG TPA: hypothetical protein VGH32_04810, partial [Pirellulales bacterium]